jgi:hypothetical protein
MGHKRLYNDLTGQTTYIHIIKWMTGERADCKGWDICGLTADGVLCSRALPLGYNNTPVIVFSQ